MKIPVLLFLFAVSAHAQTSLQGGAAPSVPAAQSAPAAEPAPQQPGVSSTTRRLGTSTIRPDCSLGEQGGACEDHAVVISGPLRQNGTGDRGLMVNHMTTYGPSVNFGNAGGWTVTHVSEAPHIIFGTSGIDQYQEANILKNGTGDLAGLYYYVYGGGRAAQADEGVEGLVIESGEINGYFHGTISGGAGAGSTALTLALSKDAPHNWAYTCAGCMLLDISKGKIAGSLNGKSIPFGSTYLNQLPTTAVTVSGTPASLPLTHAWCQTLAAIPPTDTAGIGTSRTLNCTLGAIGGTTPAFTAGGVVTVAGQWYPEQASLVSVGQPSAGVQSLTLLARNPNPVGSLIFQGGIAGQSLSFDANLAATGFRTSYYVFGSVDGINLIYGSQVGGLLRGNLLPRIGAEAETNTSGFHLYPSAEITANSAQPSDPALEPNSVNWQNGDAVEDPRFQSFSGEGMRDVCRQYTPTDGSRGFSVCLGVQMTGPAISGTYLPFAIFNNNKMSSYLGGGGLLDPVPVLRADGPFGDIFQVPGPSRSTQGFNAIIDVRGTSTGDNTPFNLFALPSGRNLGATSITYDPATKLVGFPQGLTAGSIATVSNCSAASAPANCGYAPAGSFVLPAGSDSVTVVTGLVTANSQILITPDASLSTKLGVACNRNPASAFAPFGISARTPGRSFTLSLASAANAGPNCYSYTIVN